MCVKNNLHNKRVITVLKRGKDNHMTVPWMCRLEFACLVLVLAVEVGEIRACEGGRA
jgi:hypothetical protein